MGIKTVNSIVTDAMYKYDHNKNGVIDLTKPDGFWNQLTNRDERVRSSTQTYNSKDPNTNKDKVNISSQVYTMRDLFYAADKDGDSKVTREELTAEVSKFADGEDGELKSRGFFGGLMGKAKLGLDKFNERYGERLTNYSNVSF